MKKMYLLLAFGCVVCALPLHAQQGCVDSPENPTVVLALVGGAGAAVASLRNRLRAGRRSR